MLTCKHYLANMFLSCIHETWLPKVLAVATVTNVEQNSADCTVSADAVQCDDRFFLQTL